MTTLLIATRNLHKVEEIRAILPREFKISSLRDFSGSPEVKEDAATFTGNATKKAVELARWLASSNSSFRVPHSEFAFVLADDSGLEVDALNGAPGVHSARFAAVDAHKDGNTPDADNNAKLMRLLKDIPLDKRTARFRCVLALTPVSRSEPTAASPVCSADEFELQTELFEGNCEGRIGFAPGGGGGFGYDPLFIPDGYRETFAELGEDIKNKISHRAKALGRLRVRLESLKRRP